MKLFLILFSILFVSNCTTPTKSTDTKETIKKQKQIATKDIPHPSYSIVAELFPGIRGITFDNSLTLYIADTTGAFHPKKRIYTLAKPYDGQLKALPMQFTEPTGIVSKNNALYIADKGRSEVAMFSKQNKKIRSWRADSPIALLESPQGLLSLSSGGAVERLRSNGKIDQVFSGLINPTAITNSQDGNLWIAEAGSSFVKPRVTKRDFKGNIVDKVDHKWESPRGLTVDKFNQLWIADPKLNGVFVSINGTIKNGDSVFNTPSFFHQFTADQLLLLEDGKRPRLIKISLD